MKRNFCISICIFMLVAVFCSKEAPKEIESEKIKKVLTDYMRKFFQSEPKDEGPSTSQIINDWIEYFNSELNKRCRQFVTIEGVEILGKSVEENKADVILEVRGFWGVKEGNAYYRSRDPHFFGGACYGFTEEKGFNQVVEKQVNYKKYDSGWRRDGHILELYRTLRSWKDENAYEPLLVPAK